MKNVIEKNYHNFDFLERKYIARCLLYKEKIKFDLDRLMDTEYMSS